MSSGRRTFLASLAAAGLPATMASLSGCAPSSPSAAATERYENLGRILKQPVLKHELFPDPVILETVELLRLGNTFLCRVRSKDGAEGISVAHSSMVTLYPIFVRNLQPFFVGKDARELDRILDRIYIYNFNFRLSGLALGLPLATIEFAILDMLGRIAGKPVGELIGDIHHREVGVYTATEWREKPVQESIKLIQEAVAAYDVRALKIKVGGLMFMTSDLYAKGPAGRTEEIIPLVRKTFGDAMALYADSNSFYTVPEAIRVGRLLEQYNYRYFE